MDFVQIYHVTAVDASTKTNGWGMSAGAAGAANFQLPVAKWKFGTGNWQHCHIGNILSPAYGFIQAVMSAAGSDQRFPHEA